MKTKILPIKSLVMDKEVYPRTMIDWMQVVRYEEAMMSGAVFPPITVTKYKGKWIVIDGFHRVEAKKKLKEKYIEAEILNLKTKKEIYIEAVKRNIGHGRQFSSYERTKIILTLEKWKLSQVQISEIVRIPVEKITPFVAKRITRITETREEIPLKAPLKVLSGTEVEDMPVQRVFSNQNQIQILDSLICLLENNYIDLTSEIIVEKLRKLQGLIERYV